MYIYIYIYIYMYMHLYIYMHTHIHKYICVYTYVYIYIYIYVCMFVRAAEASTPHTSKQTHCNTLQRTATHCNTLQHTATHRRVKETYCLWTHMGGAACVLASHAHALIYVCVTHSLTLIHSLTHTHSLTHSHSFTHYPPDPINYLCSLPGVCFHKSIWRIVQYKCLKCCSKDFTLQDLILRTRLCGTGYIPQHYWVVDFHLTQMVRLVCTRLVPAPKGQISGAGP